MLLPKQDSLLFFSPRISRFFFTRNVTLLLLFRLNTSSLFWRGPGFFLSSFLSHYFRITYRPRCPERRLENKNLVKKLISKTETRTLSKNLYSSTVFRFRFWAFLSSSNLAELKKSKCTHHVTREQKGFLNIEVRSRKEEREKNVGFFAAMRSKWYTKLINICNIFGTHLWLHPGTYFENHWARKILLTKSPSWKFGHGNVSFKL